MSGSEPNETKEGSRRWGRGNERDLGKRKWEKTGKTARLETHAMSNKNHVALVANNSFAFSHLLKCLRKSAGADIVSASGGSATEQRP